MARTINLADTKGRNAEVVFSGKTKKPITRQTGPKGEAVKNIRILKGSAENSFQALLGKSGDTEKVAQSIISSDPEINLLMTGRIISSTARIILGPDFKPASRVKCMEKVFQPDGTLKEERPVKENPANILLDYPVRGNRLISKSEAAKKFVFTKKYQLLHSNGLTFEFLYSLAEELQENKSLLILGAGPRGNEPLVFLDGGKNYRGFLEGRIKDGKYLLLLHLSNLEIKSIL
jgi:hypothetical protein